MFSPVQSPGHQFFMHRCLQLARLGAGYVAPNPMVGAVLVYENRIIGEGYHQRYGEAHAEVNCVASVNEEEKGLIPHSTLYVSLEPCAHFGRTPPCADLIIARRIPRVVIGCRDPFEQVNGKGIEKLEAAGVEVTLLPERDPMATRCRQLNERFFTFHTRKRPYVILKWSQTANGYISAAGNDRLLISNDYSNRLVHRWRSEEAAILVGTNTALADDPALTTRLWPGPSPVRLVVDRELRLPSSLKVFDDSIRTIIFNTVKQEVQGNISYYKIGRDAGLVTEIMDALYQLNIQSVLVEGGARLLQSFIDEDAWDEARIIRSAGIVPDGGMPAPQLKNALPTDEQILLSDTITIYKPVENPC